MAKYERIYVTDDIDLVQLDVEITNSPLVMISLVKTIQDIFE